MAHSGVSAGKPPSGPLTPLYKYVINETEQATSNETRRNAALLLYSPAPGAASTRDSGGGARRRGEAQRLRGGTRHKNKFWS